MNRKFSIESWIFYCSLVLNLAFAACVIVWLSHRYNTFRITRTIFSFSDLHPRDANPLSTKACRAPLLTSEASDPASMVLLGDSIVEFRDWKSHFKQLPVLNFGIAGDWTDCVIYRLPLVVRVAPKAIVLAVGINDLIGKRNPEAIAANHWRIVASLRQSLPQATIYISSILPTVGVGLGSEVTPEKVLELNEWLLKIADEFDVIYLDSYSALADPSGRMREGFSTDGVHLTESGYRALAGAWMMHQGRTSE